MQLNTRVRTAATALTLLAGLGLGATVPATAAPHGGAAHSKSAAKAGGKGEHGKPAKGEHGQAGKALRKLSKEIARKDAALGRAASDHRLAGLDAETADAVRANVATDRMALVVLGDAAAASTTPEDLAAAVTAVHQVRPEGYRILVNELRRAARVQAALDAALSADPTADTSEAQALLDAAVADALAFHAGDPKSVLRGIHADLSAAKAAVEALASDDGTDEGTDEGTGDESGEGTGDGSGDGTGDGTDPTDPAPADPTT